jgi:hypothetical protein
MDEEKAEEIAPESPTIKNYVLTDEEIEYLNSLYMDKNEKLALTPLQQQLQEKEFRSNNDRKIPNIISFTLLDAPPNQKPEFYNIEYQWKRRKKINGKRINAELLCHKIQFLVKI